MKALSISLLLVSLFISGCHKQANKTTLIRARVVQTSNVDCYLPVLNFSEDSSQIRSLTGNKDIAYVVKNLPTEFNIQNKKLYVSVTTLSAEEDFACITFGPSLSHLKILHVEDRQ